MQQASHLEQSSGNSMPRFTFKKLIRDKILELHKQAGHAIDYRILNGSELKEALRLKLHEETDEIPVRDVVDDEIIEEIADVQQIIDDLKAEYSVSDTQLEMVQKAKHDKKGGFRRGVFVDTVEADETDEWTSYYRRHPLKYHELLPTKDIFDVPEIEAGVYRHYKGKQYEVLGVGCHTETNEYYVVYSALYEQENVPKIWIRPYEMFIESVESNGSLVKRFTKIS